MLRLALGAVLIGYLPGALIFRLPIAARERRAQLDAEERTFWHVILSLGCSLIAGLALAASGAYRFDRLLLLDAALCAVLLLAGRTRLLYRGNAARVSWTVVLPLILITLGVWRFFPSSEYVIGGKDPGTYINEGIQIAQRGSLTIRDAEVAAVPESVRDLFFPPWFGHPEAFSVRFMGFFVQDPRSGDVIGQLPHLFPLSIAFGYGLHGLTGARVAVGLWGLLGVLAVYFSGARFVGRAAAFGGAVLLALNILTVFFARYPNAELLMQALLFAALLAFARAHQDDDRFFGPVAGALAGLLIFARLEAFIAIAGMLGAAVLGWLVDHRKLRVGFLLPLAILSIAGWLYLSGPLRAYFWLPLVFVQHLPVVGIMGGLAAAITAFIVLFRLRRRTGARTASAVPLIIVVAIVTLAAYAWFLRAPGGKLTDYDAYALRTFGNFYLLPFGLILALAGFAMVVGRRFWRDPAFVTVFSTFCLFFFYKPRVVPEHFWADRRFLPVILPAALLFAASWLQPSQRRRAAVAGVLLVALGYQYVRAAQPVMPHVEYAGVIPFLERLASRFSDRDLVVVESRDAGSDTFVMALPLSYIYARHVLVLHSPRPDKTMLAAFLDHALTRYDRVFFLGGGGTDLLSRRIVATPVGEDRVGVPEYESSAWNVFPTVIKRKDFEYGIYQLAVGTPIESVFSLDVGSRDDLNCVRFNAKESSEGRTIRWTQDQSFVAIPGMTGQEREVVLVMHDGGRPAQAPRAQVRVSFDEVPIGTIDVTSGFKPYSLKIPAELAQRAAARDDPAQLKLESTVWNPHELLGAPDNRALGVMLDRVEIR